MQLNQKFFFDTARASLFDGKLTQKQTEGLNAILSAWQREHAGKDDRWLAYALATAHHETDRTMQPIEEYGRGKNRKYGKRVKLSGKAYSADLPIYYGRGYVQLTWYENYEKASKKIGLDFLRSPEMVMDPVYAARIMFEGMETGWFTGKKFADYFSDSKSDWVNARRIINGTDKAQLIASYAQRYYRCLSYMA